MQRAKLQCVGPHGLPLVANRVARAKTGRLWCDARDAAGRPAAWPGGDTARRASLNRKPAKIPRLRLHQGSICGETPTPACREASSPGRYLASACLQCAWRALHTWWWWVGGGARAGEQGHSLGASRGKACFPRLCWLPLTTGRAAKAPTRQTMQLENKCKVLGCSSRLARSSIPRASMTMTFRDVSETLSCK